ncbi:MAG TPA: YbhB/YbcL family Raf kinase inhibitor-like protein [Chitinophagaceae bacterium]|nr:YbhB/YbcL family Raf kinase inhibitor-like protein [Chitinophagaceae bacterium]
MRNAVSLFAALFLLSCFSSAQTFTLRSADLGGQASPQQVFNGFGCNGSNLSPQLSWENAPEGTKSFAITIYDKDAPTGSGWWHWLVFNIPANIKELKQDAGNSSGKNLPAGAVQSITDFGQPGYGGPCPPPGRTHQYTITIHALDTDNLKLDPKSNPATVGFNINSRTIQKASIVFYYKR